jgi:hypothetical protein
LTTVSTRALRGDVAARPEPSDKGGVGSRPHDLLVKALNVQGGEADIGGVKTAFARIVMSGVDLEDASRARAPKRQECAVLKLDAAAALAGELREIVNGVVRSSPTPAVPALGTWIWTCAPPLDEDLLVVRASASGTAVPAAGVRSIVRVDLTGTLVRGLSSSNPPVHVQGAVFSGTRQIQALVSSLGRLVHSALEQRRTESYLSAETYLPSDQPLSAFGF